MLSATSIASAAAQLGASVHELAEMLNHSDTNTVKRYVHGIAPDAALGRVRALLDGASQGIVTAAPSLGEPPPISPEILPMLEGRSPESSSHNVFVNRPPSAPFGQPMPKDAPSEIVWRLSLSFSRLSRPPTEYIFGKV
jgi:hypothetical protein